jgi:hypothetical protein
MADRAEAPVVSLDDLAQPGSRSIVGSLPGGIGSLLGEPAPTGLLARLLGRVAPSHAFRVPDGTEPQVDLLVHQGKGRVMLVHRSWVVTFAAASTDAADSASEPALRLELACSLAFPERDGQVAAQREAERIVALVERSWCAPAD